MGRTWKYHPVEGPKLFDSEEAALASGLSWYDSPAHFPTAESVAPPVPEVKAPVEAPKRRGRPPKSSEAIES